MSAGSGRLDLRIALRRLARRPAATAVAAATMALGIGGCVAMFALCDALLLRPLRFAEPDRLVALWERDQNGEQTTVGWQTVDDWRRQASAFSGVAAMSSWLPTLLGEGDAERLEGLRVTDDFFPLLGVEPALGRLFSAAEHVRGTHHVALLSHGLWQRRFGASPEVIGRGVRFDGVEYRVVGVLSADFENVLRMGGMPPAEVWAPLAYNASLPWSCRTCRHLRAVGRLRPGVEIGAARAELNGIMAGLAAEHRQDYPGSSAAVLPLHEDLFGPSRPLLYGLLGAVSLVLLMAAANVGAMLLAAAAPRSAEMGVRVALGARRRDVARLLLLESAAIAALGAGLGVGVAHAVLGVAVRFAPRDLPRLAEAAIDGRALGLAIALAAVSALLFGAAPALAAGRAALAGSLAGAHGVVSSRRRHRLLAALVSADVALAVVLLAGAGLLGKSVARLQAQPPGFRAEGLLTMRLLVSGERADDAAATLAFYDELVARASGLPGFRAAAVTSQLPLSGDFDGYGVHPEGAGDANPELDPSGFRHAVTPGYLETMEIPLVAGRGLTAEDRRDSRKAVVVSRALARRLWPAGEALERRVKLGGTGGPWWTVVGVVDDVRQQGLEEPSDGAFYVPLAQWESADTYSTVVVRAAGDPATLAGPLRALVRELDRDVAVSQDRSMVQVIGESTATRRFSAALFAGFAAIALLLAALGVHGVVAHAVGERRRELGLRRALGARGVQLAGLLLRQLLRMAATGAAAGLLGAVLFGRLLRSQLYAVGAADPAVLATGVVTLVAVVLAAALGPARRAARVDPARMLRQE